MPAQKKLAKDQIQNLTAEDMRDFMYGAIQDMIEGSNAPKNVSFDYFMPPIPFGAELASFMSLGNKKEDFKKKGLDNNDMARAAVNFATIVDYVPLLSDKKEVDSESNVVDINTLISSGVRISDLYKSILTNCRVFDNERSEEDQKKLEALRSLLYKDFPEKKNNEENQENNTNNPLDDIDDLLGVNEDLSDDDLLSLDDNDSDEDEINWDSLMSDGASQDDFVTDPDMLSSPTMAKKLYDALEFKFIQVYLNAREQLQTLSPNDPNADMVKKALRIKLRSAKNRWITQGRKVKVEGIMARIEQLSQEGMPQYVSNLRDIFEGSQLSPSIFTDENLGSSLLSERAYYTALRPNGILDAPSLLSVSISSSNTESWRKFERKKTKGGAIIPLFKLPGFVSGGAESVTRKINSEFLKEDFSISFEIVQGLIDRQWLDLGFLESRAYTTVDPRTNKAIDPIMQITQLSDGGNPPKSGMLPAIPVTAYFIRNLKVTSKAFANISDSEAKTFKGRVGINILGFGGSVSRHKHTNETSFSRASTTGTIEAKGTFLVGMSSRYLKKSPNPDFEAFPKDKWV